jgi:hypothetical protein
MSDSVNPYQSPAAEAVPVQPAGAAGSLNDNMLSSLREAAPWARFLGIMGYIQCGFVLLLGLVFIVLLPAAVAGSNVGGIAAAALGGMRSILGFVYIIGGVLLFFPARFLYTMGNRIRGYLRSGADHDLETAFRNAKSLLKFLGIVVIVSLALIPVSIIVSVVIIALQ